MTATRLFPAFLVLAVASLAPPVQGAVYKCIDANGGVTYTNDPSAARGCQTLSGDQPVSTVPAPAPVDRPRPPARQGAPNDFPRVAPEAQRARDDVRREVLEKELAAEERALADAKAALVEQEEVRYGNERNYQKVLDRLQPFKDKVELHQRNIDALKKELAALK